MVNFLLRRTAVPTALAVALLGGLSACGGDETGPEDHTPATYRLLVNGTEMTQPYTIAPNQTTRIQIKFYNAANDDLDDVETSHYGLLTFTPATLATATIVAGHHYQFDVAAGAAATGTVVVSYGHGEDADEKVFTAVAFRVQ